MEDKVCMTECVNTAVNVMRFTIHAGLEITSFELHHGRKPRTELTNVIKNGKPPGIFRVQFHFRKKEKQHRKSETQ